MNPKLAMFVELLLIGIYLALVLIVFDTSTTLGLIEVGVATLVIFPLVLVIEKKREATKKASEEGVDELGGESTAPASEGQSATEAPQQPVASTQIPPTQPAAPQQPAQPPTSQPAPAQPTPQAPPQQPPAQPPQ